MFSPAEIYALFQVIWVDLALAGDNAIVVGLVAATVPLNQRKKVILLGIILATISRVIFSLIAVQLLEVIGLLLAGGILLFWVGWKLWRELNPRTQETELAHESDFHEEKSLTHAIVKIAIADITMSLDNVLAVAGVARDHSLVLIIGLLVSIGIMAVASTLVARLLQKHMWIAYVGLAIIFYISIVMMYEGSLEIIAALH